MIVRIPLRALRIPMAFALIFSFYHSTAGRAAGGERNDKPGSSLPAADAVDCAPDGGTKPSVPAPGLGPVTELERYAEMDRIVRQGCAVKPMLRAWQSAHERLAPFTVEPDPNWRLRAAEVARSMPVASARSGRSAASGADGGWTSLGPTNQAGRVRSIAIDPRDENVVYVAAAGGGVWKTIDAGTTWAAMTDSLTGLSSGAVAIDPSAPGTLYFGTGEGTINTDAIPGVGVFKSTDGGSTWNAAGTSFSTRISAMAVLPTTPSSIFAASEKGAYRSTDGGASWVKIVSGDSSSVIVPPGSTNEAWIGIGAPFGDGKNTVFHYSVDANNAVTLTKANSTFPSGCGRIILGAGESSTKTVYAECADLAQNGGTNGIWKTTDGTTWAKLPGSPAYCVSDAGGQCWYDNAVAVDPSNPANVWLGGIDVYKATDGGTTFVRQTAAYTGGAPYIHPDQHAISISPTGVAWVANDGGIYVSHDGGTSWDYKSVGLVTSQYYGIAQDPVDAFPILGGLQDNGNQRYLGHPDNWSDRTGGDGGYTAIDQQNPRTMYGEYVYLDIEKSVNGGGTFSRHQTTGIPDAERFQRAMFIAPFAIDEARSNRLLAGTNKVYLTTTSASSWNAVTDDITESGSGAVSALAFAPADPGIAWAGTDTGRVWTTSTVGSGLWTNVTKAPLPGGYVKRILVDPTDSQKVYIAYSGSSGANVFRSSDGGGTWSNISGNLPSAPANGLAVDPNNTSRIWVGTDVGVFYTENIGASWVRYGANFPSVRVDELIFQKTLRLLRAGTHGRGVWEISADLTVVAPPAADFTYTPTPPLSNVAVTFTDTSTGSPTSWSWEFGDGTTSSERNPVHSFATAGLFSVSLTASNVGGSSVKTKFLNVGEGTPAYLAGQLVPGQARAAGAGAFFKTTFWMTNPGSTDSKVRLEYVPVTGGSGGGAAATKDVTISAGRSVAYQNVLADLFGATTDTSGVVVVNVLSGTPAPLVTSRTFNDAGAAGTYGQFIPAVSLSEAASGPVWLYGLGGDATNRTNVGVVNLGTATISATISVFDKAGNPLGQGVTVSVSPHSAVQKNKINEAAGAGALDVFSAKVTATGNFFAYGSKLDNKTSDPIFIASTLEAKSTQWIDGAAAAAGSGGTYFRSNLSLTNPGSSSASVALTFTKREDASPTGSPATVNLAAGETKYYLDAVKDLFAQDGVAGYLSMKTSGTTPVTAWARTYNDLGAAGTFGQFIPGFGPGETIGTNGAILQGLSESSAFRTNMGLINSGAASVNVTVSLWKSDGSKVGEKVYTLGAGKSHFVSKVMSTDLGGSNISDGYLKVTPSSGGAVYAWASSVDNVSTDQIFVTPLAIP